MGILVINLQVRDSQCHWKQWIYTAHIKNLFYTFVWNFCPQLILDGYIYAGIPPLYRITMGKKYQYLKDDAALLEFREVNKGKSYEVNRLKG